MRLSIAVVALVTIAARDADGQRTRVAVSGGEVASNPPTLAKRLAPMIPGVPEALRARLRVSGDSAQRLALEDFDWRGRVSSVEIDELDSRLFWDVKIIPDSTRGTLVRYRIDASTGGILDIREFTGIRGLAHQPPH